MLQTRDPDSLLCRCHKSRVSVDPWIGPRDLGPPGPVTFPLPDGSLDSVSVQFAEARLPLWEPSWRPKKGARHAPQNI